jgi:ribose 5-phosphate isomerase B
MSELERYYKETQGFVVAMASDHAGVDMRTSIRDRLASINGGIHRAIDYGPMPIEGRVDYPDYANKVAISVLTGEASRGILVCGSGIGMSMAANRHPGIRCALVHDITTARLSRLHNNANILALGARLIGPDLAWEIVEEWLRTSYEGGRHDRRIAKMDAD